MVMFSGEPLEIDTVIGLPANLFYSTGIPVSVLVRKKCKRHDDVLFINVPISRVESLRVARPGAPQRCGRRSPR